MSCHVIIWILFVIDLVFCCRLENIWLFSPTKCKKWDLINIETTGKYLGVEDILD